MKLRAAAAALPALAACGAWAGDFTIAERGSAADCAVVLPADAGACLRYAAEELTNYVALTTGVALPVAADLPSGKAIVFSVGKTRSLPSGSDGFRLQVANGRLFVRSPTERGCLYGAYEILEKYAGVRWYASWRTNVPERTSVALPADLDDTQEPAFDSRETTWCDVKKNPAFSAHLRVNAKQWGEVGEKYGGDDYRFARDLDICHTLGWLLAPDDRKDNAFGTKFFEAHPDYYALSNGKRVPDQPCLTHPDVLAIVTSNALALARRDPAARFFGVSQDDNQKYCRCERCAAVDAEEGSHAGTVVRFVNAVAEAVEREFPDKIVETLAYQWSQTPPKKTRLRHNVMPCLCLSYCDFSLPLEESEKPSNKGFLDDLRSWSEMTDRIYVWDYETDFTEHYLPFANLRAMEGNFRTFRGNKVKYVFAQGSSGRHADFAELKAYCGAKWMWNPDLPLEALLDDFLPGYYGAGAPYVREYLHELHWEMSDYFKNPKTDRMHMYIGLDTKALSDAFLARARLLWTKAEEATKGDAASSYAVRMGAIGVDLVRVERARGKRARFGREDVLLPSECKATLESLMARTEEAQGIRFHEGGENGKRFAAWQEYAARTNLTDALAPSGKLAVEDKDFAGRLPCVDDPLAEDGRAVYLAPTNRGWAVCWGLRDIVKRTGRTYRLKVRVRIEPDAPGLAVEAGLQNYGPDLQLGHRSVWTKQVEPGYQWYAIAQWRHDPAVDGAVAWIGVGKGSPATVKGVWIDKFVLEEVCD